MDKLKQSIESQKQHLLITGGRRSGLTYSLLMKALNTQGSVAFVSGFNSGNGDALKQTINILKECGWRDYTVGTCRFSGGKILRTQQNTVTFIDGDQLIDYFWLKPRLNLICVDQPEQLPYSHIRDVIKYTDNYEISKAFATQPFNCAYRNPEYVNGAVVRDEEGNLLYKDYSWDKVLLNWEKVDKSNQSKKIITKLSPDHYKASVDVVTLDNREHLCPINNLPWEAKQLLTGEWEGVECIKGGDLTI